MPLKDIINTELKEIGKLENILTKEDYKILIKKGGPYGPENIPEYKVDIKSNKKTVGYIKFIQDNNFYNVLTLTAILVEESQRNKNLSDALMEILFLYAEKNNHYFQCISQQRKPISAYIFSKYGFTPQTKRIRDEVLIFGRYQNELMIAFYDNKKKEEFEKSNLCNKSQQYKIIDMPKDYKKAESITLLTPYILTKHHLAKKRREKNQKKFEITFYN
jgi:hypothetical protein